MTINERIGIFFFACALVMVGWAYLAGYHCPQNSAPVARYVSLGELGTQVTWKDESGCARQAVMRGTFAS